MSDRWIVDVTAPLGGGQLTSGGLARPRGEGPCAEWETADITAGHCIADDHVILAGVNGQPAGAYAGDRFTGRRLGYEIPDADPVIVG